MGRLLSFILLMALAAAAQRQPRPVRMVAEFPAGGVFAYEFDQSARIRGEVRPRFAHIEELNAPERSYRITGRFTATVTGDRTFEVRFERLKLSEWESPASSKGLERALQELQARKVTLAYTPKSNQVRGMEGTKGDSLERHSMQMLQMMLVLTLERDFAKRSVTPGERWVEASGSDGYGTKNWYKSEVDVAGRSCGLVLADVAGAPEVEAVDLGPGATHAKTHSRTTASIAGAALFDHLSRSAVWMRSAVNTETDIIIVAGDRDAEVRAPMKIMTVRIDVDSTTRLLRPEIAGWDYSLKAAVAPLKIGPGMLGAGTENLPAESGELSLAERARRAKAARDAAKNKLQ